MNNPYSLNKKLKELNLIKKINKSIKFHKSKCNMFDTFLLNNPYYNKKYSSLEDLPYIPVSAFKDFELLSIKKQDIHKTLISSGTTSNKPSKIFLDKKNSLDQIKALQLTFSHDYGKKRLPMLIIDNLETIDNPNYFSARTAGILGFSMFSSKRFFALDENMSPKKTTLKKFLNENSKDNFLVFGFTYLVWNFFKNQIDKNLYPYFRNAKIIHGGGWKKLEKVKISNEKFNNFFNNILKVKKVSSYYGMVEQTGSIFLECNEGFLHTSNFNEIIIRDIDLLPCKYNQIGIVQILSTIPSSYPGNSILSEDLGVIIGEDNCKCGKNGKFFKIIGRVPRSITRGCSDVV